MSGVPGGDAAWLDALVEAALAEDVGEADWTTAWSVPAALRGRARVVARAPGVLAGTVPAGRVLRRQDPGLEARWLRRDGEGVAEGDAVLEVEGSLASILTAERTALNFLARLSGIASLTARYVAAVEGTGCRVADTRKTTPGWRALEKAATRAGGARNHRQGLYDMVLLKENHLRAAGGVGPALRAVAPRARARGLEVEVEVRTLAELEEAVEGGADRILLDNMSPEELRRAVWAVRDSAAPRPLLEASGGVTLERVQEVASTGVDLVSVGALTHSAPALDLSLLVTDVEEKEAMESP